MFMAQRPPQLFMFVSIFMITMVPSYTYSFCQIYFFIHLELYITCQTSLSEICIMNATTKETKGFFQSNGYFNTLSTVNIISRTEDSTIQFSYKNKQTGVPTRWQLVLPLVVLFQLGVYTAFKPPLLEGIPNWSYWV